MKILVLCYEYPPIGGGGGRVAQTIAEQLVQRGHEVRVQTAALGRKSIREQIRGVDVFRTASGRRVADTCAVHEMGLFVATSFLPTLRHCWSWKPDVIHAHFAVPTGLLAWAARLIARKPYVLTAHLGDVPGGVPEQTDRLFRMIGPVAREIWRHAAGATAVSSFVQELAQAAYGWPVTRIVNGIDLGDAPPEPPRTAGTPPGLVFLGRFNPQKNAPLLIDALAKVQDLPWRLTMIGDGPDMPSVRRKLEAHGLESRVRLTGWLPGTEVQGILAGADVLCMPSSSEGMPVAAIESLKFGLAIVSTAIPGLRDVVDPGRNGVQAPVGDPEAFAAAIRSVLANQDVLLRFRQASWEKAKAFALPDIVSQYEQVLEEARTRR